MQNFIHNEKTFSLERYPLTTNKSLQAWSAADELMLKYFEDMFDENSKALVYNDRFGFQSVILNTNEIYSVIDYKSQQKAIEQNLSLNGLSKKRTNFIFPLQATPSKVNLALIKTPKSTEHFELYLNHASLNLAAGGIVICGFMTKYFSPQLIEISEKYFNSAEQSMATKKARVLVLSDSKNVAPKSLINTIEFQNMSLKQHFGVFSSDHIDYATQFLIENLNLNQPYKTALDVGCGNGVIGKWILEKSADTKVHFMDDSYLAIESAKLNISDEKTEFHFTDTLEAFESDSIDLVVSNPPFHLDHEINIEVTISLFKEIQRLLAADGKFKCVANMHLNYKTHLDTIFSKTTIVAENAKFVVYECEK